MATNEQMKQEYSIFAEAWRFFKKYYEPLPEDSYWDQIVLESTQLVHKYRDLQLCKDLFMAIINELDRNWRGKYAIHENR